MGLKTEQDIINAFKTAAQTAQLRQPDGSFPPFVLSDDIATMQYVLDVLLPKVPDLRTRRIIWLRSQGMCWKRVARETSLTERSAYRIFKCFDFTNFF